MGPRDRIVIIGAGLAAVEAVEAIRREGSPVPITVVGDETHLPYLRPPLSKDVLLGRSSLESVVIHDADWFAERDVELLIGESAVSIDPDLRLVLLADGRRLPFGSALIATGSRARRLPTPGADLNGVHYLRRLEDCDRLRRVLAQAHRIVIIGAGWIGLEVASAARTAGLEVAVIAPESVPLEHVVGAQVGQFFADLHADHGVRLMMQSSVSELVGVDGTCTGVRLSDGRVLDADAVVVGIGAQPNVEVASASHISVADGIVVDEGLQTSLTGVFAAGDVANAYNRRLHRHVRVEHWDNAKRQGAAAGLGLLGRISVYDRLPFFYSDQFDVGLEYTGYAPEGTVDTVVLRGNPDERRFAAFWVGNGRVQAGMTVNIWDLRPQIEALVESQRVVDARRLADEDIPLDLPSVA